MSLFELLKLAFTALILNRTRSLLTMLGIIIGVASVVTLLSFGQSYQHYVENQFSGIGTTTLFIGSSSPKGVTNPLPLTMADYQAIANPQNVSSVLAVAPVFTVSATLVANGQSMAQSVTGTNDLYATVRAQAINTGRLLTATDVNTSSLVAVIGSAIVTKLYPGVDPLNQPLHINGQVFTVVGVLQSTSGGQGNADKVVLVPITTAFSRLASATARTAAGDYKLSQISVMAVAANAVNQVKTDITTLLSARHKIQYVGLEDFNVFSQGQILGTLDSILGLLQLFLGLIASISLLVGGIGVMNIMLVSVTERTREIGLRKALGAKYENLLMQFLIESVTLCLLGGLLGILLGVGLSELGGALLPTLHVTISVPAIFLAVGVSSAIGVFFGLYPATRAAVLKPIEALRYE